MLERILTWGVAGGVLVLVFRDAWHWYPVAGLPWVVGAICLWRLPPGAFGALVGTLRESRMARITLVLLGGVLVTVAWLFGIGAGIVALTAVAAVGLLALLVRGPRPAFELLAGLSVTTVTLLAIGAIGEAVVSYPAVGARWGSPEELASWRERYDELAREGNLFGFRSPYEEIAKPPATFRVVVLGDSYTWGDKIARTEDTWPARLEAILADRHGNVDVQVVNLARRGFTTANEVELMSRLGWQFEPDLVFIQFFVNDVFRSWPGLGRVGSDQVFESYRLLPTRFRRGAAGGSALVAFLEQRLNGLLQNADYHSLYDEGAEGWTQLQRALRKLGADARARGVRVVMLQTPRFVPGRWAAGSHPDREIHARVAEAAEGAGVSVVDLIPVFRQIDRPGEEWWATPYDSHPSEEAHAVFAREAAREVPDGLLETASGSDAPVSLR